jgi:hypothetical protein
MEIKGTRKKKDNGKGCKSKIPKLSGKQYMLQNELQF